MASQVSPYVVMIEDDPDDIFFAEFWMKELSIEIPTHFIHDAEKVFEWLDAQSSLPTLIILDRRLPAIEGIEILKQLKAHPEYCSVPVIMLSGSGFPEEIREYYAAGASSYVLKPKGANEKTAERIKTFINYWFHFCQLPPTVRTKTFMHEQ